MAEEHAEGHEGPKGQGNLVGGALNELAKDLLTAPSALHEDVERHLLLASLDPQQRLSVRARGWFVIDWPKQFLVLKVHTRRVPTVDAYQAPSPRLFAGSLLPGAMGSTALRDEEPEALFWAGASWSELVLAAPPRPVYLCSFDVRTARRAVDAPLDFRLVGATPTAMARLVCEALRRGELERLLAASEAVRVSELVDTPLDVAWRPSRA